MGGILLLFSMIMHFELFENVEHFIISSPYLLRSPSFVPFLDNSLNLAIALLACTNEKKSNIPIYEPANSTALGKIIIEKIAVSHLMGILTVLDELLLVQKTENNLITLLTTVSHKFFQLMNGLCSLNLTSIQVSRFYTELARF